MLGKYELFEELGSGGYGTVYHARDTVLEVERAVKLLHPALVADRLFIERFKHEARYAARLKNPHIVQVYDLGESEGRFFLAMEYMPGGSLKDLLARQGRLPFARAVEITDQVADALEYIHTQNLVHRDIKPGNILLDKKGQAAISDLGFAKALSGASSTSLSTSGGMIGTPAYMAPEVWRGRDVSPATDVYSLACVFFEMITGKVLFEGDSPPEVMTRHMLDGPQFPQKWPEGVPVDVEGVLRKALAMKPEDRLASTSLFASELESLMSRRKEDERLVTPWVLAPKSMPTPELNMSEEKDADGIPQAISSSIGDHSVRIKEEQNIQAVHPGIIGLAGRLSVNRKVMSWVARGWAIGWATGLAVGWVTLFWLISGYAPFHFGEIIVPLCGLFSGAIGGFLSGFNLRVSFRLDQKFLQSVTLGWAIGWTIFWIMVCALAISLNIFHGSASVVIGLLVGGILGGVIGGILMIWQMKRAEK